MPHDITFPDEVLEIADQFTLKDLLECPAFQAFLVSAVGNGVRSFNSFLDVVDDRDELLMYRLQKFMYAIPYDVRNACFAKVGALLRERKERDDVVRNHAPTPTVVRHADHQVRGLRS